MLNLLHLIPGLLSALLFLGYDSETARGGDDLADSPVVGHWTVATSVVDLQSGPVSVVLGGAATQSWVSSNLGANIWGTRLSYDFKDDGTYRADYRARAVFGVFVSETEASETGRFSLNGTVLILRPDQQRGWIYVGHPINRQEIDETGGPERPYEIGLLETADGTPYLFLLGTCGPFQIEPWCEKNDTPQSIGVLYQRTR
ncbi:MAG: hypothetical protein AAF170_10535 [Bacteroidota bacterium]